MSDSDLHLLYNVSAQDIAFFKQQQWRVTNYALLIYAALLSAVVVVGKPLHPWEISVGIMLSFATGAFAAWLVNELYRSIEVRRERLRCVRSHLSAEFNDCWEAKEKVNDEWINVLFYLIIVFGFLVASWAILSYSGGDLWQP